MVVGGAPGLPAPNDTGREGVVPRPSPEEIADAVMFVEDESMAGRVMIWEEGKPWRIVPHSRTDLVDRPS